VGEFTHGARVEIKNKKMKGKLCKREKISA